MINFREEIIKILDEKVESLEPKEIDKMIEVPPNYELGDFAFPVFSLAKIYRKNPAVIAEELAAEINSKYFEKIENKNAYLNFYINKSILTGEILKESVEKREDFGKENYGENKNVVVEYSSTNIAKPFHIGHIRSTVIGDSLKRIYKFLGFNTIAINHLGDYGTQFGMLIYAYKTWGSKEAIEKDPINELLKLYVKVNAVCEEDQEVKDECRYWFKELENGNEEAVEIWKWFKEVSLKEFNRVYDMLDIQFDSYNGESFYSDKMPALIEELRERNVLEESEGAEVINLDEYNLPPAIVVKSDGTTIYFTRDLAAAKYRHENYKPYKNIYVVGSQQSLHFKQLKAALKKAGFDWYDEIIHVPFGMVSLEDGTLSTRRGKVVYLEDVLNKATDKVREILNDREKEQNQKIENKEELAQTVGIGAIKFQELFNGRIKDYTFNWDKTLSFEGETGPYVQYVHARICSLLKKGNFDINNEIDATLLTEESEINIIRSLYNFTNIVEDACEKCEPYFITRYTVELAKNFNKFYNQTQILVDDEKLKNTRLLLCYTVKNVIATGLYLLGIKAPEKM
ncbi:arginine--tRNA ligase [Peptoniphilus sp. AGMB00490]|uniref:Arginine--tRNA ligase n=1 Tax=Peptoniphilus faecalis TaxID=2731255 RepID=A0A848R8J9_9FIRM|nr:arginine--tRNA ligase [Peptoniphilus faecalis]NMW85627.1 arginine--tRNA ligase [Peptoniphilus faecalis]